MAKALVICGSIAALFGTLVLALPGADRTPVDEAAVERTRDTVRLLDNVYKNAVILITETYVHDENDFPAGAAAVELFQRTAKDGSHSVRIIDVSGQPYDEANVATDEFDKEGVQRLKNGDAYYDQVVTIDGEPHLRAMTAIPVVMEKCVMCHAHYKNVPQGDAIGALTYSLPIK